MKQIADHLCLFINGSSYVERMAMNPGMHAMNQANEAIRAAAARRQQQEEERKSRRRREERWRQQQRQQQDNDDQI